MADMKNSLSVVFIFLIPISIFGQTQIQGKILKQSDSLPLPGVSVYFDGTSIGVSSGEDGRFNLQTAGDINSPLIIHALGYKRLIVQNFDKTGTLDVIYLGESQEDLDVVYLEFDPWSRKKKLYNFRREFLGKIPAALECKITNEDAIKLRYIPSTQTLVAYADKPLKIINRHLGYEIAYDLKEFTAQFSSGSSGLQFVEKVYYEGYSFFKERKQTPGKKILMNREKIYTGSTQHFMRALATQTLAENDFRIFYEKFEVLPYSYFEITKEDGLTKVKTFKDKMTILHGRLAQSAIHATDYFYIDNTGNFTPPQNVIFSGDMSLSRIAGMLPLDYKLNY